MDGFSYEIRCLPRGPAAGQAAERFLCKFIRQGIEVLIVAAIMDATATVAHVAMHFNGALLRAARLSGPCPGLQRRCAGLLAALAEVPRVFTAFLAAAQVQLENKDASEWLGCKEEDDQDKPDGAENERSPEAKPEAKPETKPQAKAPPSPGQSTELSRRSDPSSGDSGTVAARPQRPQDDSYQNTDEWRKVRAYCIRHKFCVDFNREQAGVRCTERFGECRFKHACAVCGAEEREPHSQFRCHGAWNCSGLTRWLMAFS